MVIQSPTRRQAILFASIPLIALYIIFTLKLHQLVPSISTWPTLSGLARHKLWVWTTKKAQQPHGHDHPGQEYARLASSTTRRPFSRHIVAVGDLHGDMPNARRVLRFADVVDDHGDWTGNVDFLVQTGDIIDRRDDTILLFLWMEKLREQAHKAGGTVLSHLGNHEWMNALGDWRYVYPSELKTFGTIAARQRMITTGRIGRAWATNYTTATRLPLHPSLGPVNTPYPPHSSLSLNVQKDDEEFHWRSGPDSDPDHIYNHNPIHHHGSQHDEKEKIDPLSHAAFSFVHGGLSPTYHELTPFPSRINQLSHSLLEKVQNRPQPPPHPPHPYHGLPHGATPAEHRLYDANGPLWYRGWATESDKTVCSQVDDVLRKTGTRRMIMGHTPDFHNIKSRCNGKIIIIDTGISHAYGGTLSALSIHYTLEPVGSDPSSRSWREREVVSALYPDRREVIVSDERVIEGDFHLVH
ncbi:Metallo-dependent phosphatase-like protein [Gymnopilus junonius]|uniref:Metallo-dependent phosphatase-like protein n=1 Tax=Gymnopilus junonius TaxID=109634 RepID=A0A9P5P141_GYMJU|nr:Metallo-dependent phosphatase-like protein [Gymnopilus junonius]